MKNVDAFIVLETFSSKELKNGFGKRWKWKQHYVLFVLFDSVLGKVQDFQSTMNF